MRQKIYPLEVGIFRAFGWQTKPPSYEISRMYLPYRKRIICSSFFCRTRNISAVNRSRRMCSEIGMVVQYFILPPVILCIFVPLRRDANRLRMCHSQKKTIAIALTMPALRSGTRSSPKQISRISAPCYAVKN